MVPSSRFAASWKPNVEYLESYFCPLWKKQTILPYLLAYAGIPYQVFGDSSGALALTIAWSRSAIARSGSGISAIFASYPTCVAGTAPATRVPLPGALSTRSVPPSAPSRSSMLVKPAPEPRSATSNPAPLSLTTNARVPPSS